MRKAGDLIAEYLREGKLAANRSEPIGAGAYGVVYSSDVPGNVMKQGYSADTYNDIEREANLQAIAADMGIAPRVAGVETFPGGIGNRIEMQDIRKNFEPVEASEVMDANFNNIANPKDRIAIAQQLGMLALKNVSLQDRQAANVMKNKMTGRPLQIDFGIAQKVAGEDQVMALANATADGFEAAGIGDIGSIYRATVMDLLEGGDVAEAMDVAKQGFSRLQKIK